MDIKKKLEKYLKDNLKEDKPRFRMARMKECSFGAAQAMSSCGACLEEMAVDQDVSSFIKQELNENKFQKLLFKYIDERNLKDSDVYNKAGIDRRLFSKIRSDEDYHPSKETVISLASSLELSINELEELLDSASYSLPKNNKFDLIIRFCFLEKIYNKMEINDMLHDYKCSLL